MAERAGPRKNLVPWNPESDAVSQVKMLAVHQSKDALRYESQRMMVIEPKHSCSTDGVRP